MSTQKSERVGADETTALVQQMREALAARRAFDVEPGCAINRKLYGDMDYAIAAADEWLSQHRAAGRQGKTEMIDVDNRPALAGQVKPTIRPASEAQRKAEKQFTERLAKAGWHTYRDEETGRVVTNAYEDERMELQQICGLSCEVVSKPFAAGGCVRIGPRLSRPKRNTA